LEFLPFGFACLPLDLRPLPFGLNFLPFFLGDAWISFLFGWKDFPGRALQGAVGLEQAPAR
jgi:hypothetical protein